MSATAPQQPLTRQQRLAARGPAALRRYRVMALITGTMLLALCVEMLLKYGLSVDGPVLDAIAWIPFAHGWIYVAYLVTVLDLWSLVGWGFGRLVTMVIAGVVPVMSFVMERRVHLSAEPLIAAASVSGAATQDGSAATLAP